VAAKGVAAALVMARFSAQAQACLRSVAEPLLAIKRLNALTQSLSQTDRFITLVVLVLDPHAHTVSVVNAGHLPPLLLRHATSAFEEMDEAADFGSPLAVAPGYDFQSHQFALERGDTVTLLSDGITLVCIGRRDMARSAQLVSN
jgi:phosphoserine phosphatase RsbU/P